MEIKFKLDSIKREYVAFAGEWYNLELSSYAIKMDLRISEDEYKSMVKEIGPFVIGVEIPVTLPGEEVADLE